MSSRLPSVCCAFAGLLLLVAPTWGDEASTKEGLTELFDSGWQATIKGRTAAKERYEGLRAATPGDIRITHAYALVQVKQRNYAEAIKLFDEVLAADKTDLHAQKARGWLSIITKNYAAALVDLDRFSQLLPADLVEAAAEEQMLEQAKYLGRVFGYLEGPAADGLGAPQRDAAKKKILARLSEPRQLAFEEGRTRVLAAFNGLGAEKEDSQEKAKVVAEDEREKLLADLETRKDQIAARRSEIGPQREKLRGELKDEQDQLAKEERPFLSELNAINAQGAGARRELNFIATDILRLRALLDKEKDPVLRDRLRRDLDRANLFAARIDANLVALERQATGVRVQLAEVQRRHVQAANRISGELARLDAEGAALDKQEKRNDLDTTKARKPAVGDVRRSRSISAQAAAFTTYEEFPLEAERQRLLDSYK